MGAGLAAHQLTLKSRSTALSPLNCSNDCCELFLLKIVRMLIWRPSVRSNGPQFNAASTTPFSRPRTQIIGALVEGNSIRSTERMTNTHRDTIMRLMKSADEIKADIEPHSIPNADHLIIDPWRRVDEPQSKIVELERQAREPNQIRTLPALDFSPRVLPCSLMRARYPLLGLESYCRRVPRPSPTSSKK
jgi:hypothetical protein